jgi:hypothetical protein
MSRPGIEPGPPAWEASTLEKSHLDSLFCWLFGTTTWAEAGAARGLYMAPPQCMYGHGLDWVWRNSPLHIAMRASALST